MHCYVAHTLEFDESHPLQSAKLLKSNSTSAVP
jgi:hypothetical protein